jgi:CBS domain-containing protein
MTTARDLMSSPAQTLNETDSLVTAAQAFKHGDVGSMPVLAADGRLVGMVTDRDLVVRGLADGIDPGRGTLSDVLTETVVVLNVDDEVDAIVRAFSENQVRRVPVLDGQEVVGIISQADIARELSNERTGQVVEAISRD